MSILCIVFYHVGDIIFLAFSTRPLWMPLSPDTCIHWYVGIFITITRSLDGMSLGGLVSSVSYKLNEKYNWIVLLSHLSFLHYTRIRIRAWGMVRSQAMRRLYSLSGKTSYCQISWSLEDARLNVIMAVSLWNLTGISAALLPRCLTKFRAIGKV